jgi:hypothetical protein
MRYKDKMQLLDDANEPSLCMQHEIEISRVNVSDGLDMDGRVLRWRHARP